MNCVSCSGELKTMKRTITFNDITFLNVPVHGCKNCDDVTYSINDGLIMGHYKEKHCKSGDIIDFTDVQILYMGMSTLDLMSLNSTSIQ